MLIPTLLVFTQWTIILIVLFGLGSLAQLVFGLKVDTEVRFSALGWLGLAIAIPWLYLIHVVVPLNAAPAWLPLLTLGMTGWIPLIVRQRPSKLRSRLLNPTVLVLTISLILTTLYLANQALGEPLRFDSYLYHFSAIDFHTRFEVIEGLANMHDRLGFQTPVFPLAATAGVGFWPDEGFRIVNGVFILLALFELISRLSRAWGDRALSWGSASYLIGLSLFVGFDGGSLQPRDLAFTLASPDIDIAAAIVLITAAAYFIDAISSPAPLTVGLALLTGALAAVFRPTNLVFFGVTVLCLGLVWLKQSGRRSVNWSLICLSGVSLLVLFSAITHTILLTGYPLYPAPLFGLDLPWTVPLEEVRATSLGGIRDFARFTYPGIEPQSILPWFGEWVGWLHRTGELRDLIWVPLVFLFGTLLILLGQNKGRGSLGIAWLLGLALAPPVATLGVWLYSAPLIRFGHAPLVILASLPLGLVLSQLDWKGLCEGVNHSLARRSDWAALIGLAVIIAFAWIPEVDGLPSPLRESGDGRFGSILPYKPKMAPNRLGGDWIRLTPADAESATCGRQLRCSPNRDPRQAVEFLDNNLEDGLRRAYREAP